MTCLLAESVFTPTHHLVVLVLFVATITAVLWYGRRGERQARVTARRMGLLGIGIWLISGIYYSIPPELKPHESLPIQACDLLALIAAITMLRPVRVLRAVTYFGSFGLTLQAFITPVITTGPDTMKFYIFWLLHASIISCALFDLVVRRYRPAFRDLLLAVGAWAVYGVLMMALNYSTFKMGLNGDRGWYYGYLSPIIPPNAENTVLQFLGPWPIRPIAVMALALTLFTLLWLPWAVVGMLRKKTKPRTA